MSVLGEAMSVGFTGFVKTVSERRRAAREHADHDRRAGLRIVISVAALACGVAAAFTVATGWGLLAAMGAGLVLEWRLR